jgi:hypothetical protein
MKKRFSKILSEDLPADHASRIKRLKEYAGSLPFYERYIAGEYEPVWAALAAPGEDVRRDPLATDALAVAFETMYRASENVRILVARLHGLGFKFSSGVFSPYSKTALVDGSMLAILDAQIDELEKLAIRLGPPTGVPEDLVEGWKRSRVRNAEQARARSDRRAGIVHPHMPPARVTSFTIRRVEQLGGLMPLSLRAWYETVGGVNLVGECAGLGLPGLECDPLFVAPPDLVLDISKAWREDSESGASQGPFRIPISPDRTVKMGASTHLPLYEIQAPNPGMDGMLDNEPHRLPFVQYLRRAFAWGGFPGCAGTLEDVPPVIHSLRAGLLPL